MSLSLKDACLKAVEQSKRIASVKRTCTYKTPCGWCTKWDKKCNRKVGYGDNSKPKRGLRAKLGVYDDAITGFIDV